MSSDQQKPLLGSRARRSMSGRVGRHSRELERGFSQRVQDIIARPPQLPDGVQAVDRDLEGQDAAQLQSHLEDHYSDRAPWLRAAVLGANDGLVSVASIMLGVSGGTPDSMHILLLSGLSALVAGAMSMAAGEYISVSSQRDTEQADIDKEIAEQQLGPEARERELQELINIWKGRGLDESLAKQVAVRLTETDVIRAHARDELGIDIDELVSPWQAALSSFICFTVGGGVPLLSAAFIRDPLWRTISVALASTVALLVFGAVGAYLGGAKKILAALRVLIGGWLAFGLTYGVGKAFGTGVA